MSDLILSLKEFPALSAEILRKGGTFRFRASGGSMSPFIRDGAVLTVEPVQPGSLRPGDTILYRVGDGALVHRLLLKRNRGGRAELIVSGDALFARLERVSADHLLGRVIRVQQDGKITDIRNCFRRLGGLIWAAMRLSADPVLSPWRSARMETAKILMAMQGLGLYRRIARTLLGKRVHYRSAVIDDAAQLARLFGYGMNPYYADPVGEVRAQIEGFGTAAHILIATINGKLIGAIVIQRLPETVASGPDWWVSDFIVRLRYRGAGIGRGLLIKAAHKICHEPEAKLGGQFHRANKSATGLGTDLDGQEIDPWRFFLQLGDTVADQSNSTRILYRPVDEFLTALEAAGLLEQYRGTGCCDAD